MKTLIRIGKGVGGFVVLAALWELARLTGLFSPTWAPSVAAMVGTFLAGFVDGAWATALPSTLLVWLGGVVTGTLIGVVWGSWAGSSSWAYAGSSTVIAFLRPVPAVAILPVAILVLGLRPQMIWALVAFGAIWPVLFNTLYAYRDMPGQYHETARMLGHSRVIRFLRVELVASLPGIVTGFKVSVGLGLMVAVSVELIVGTTGLGAYIAHARAGAQISEAYAGLIMAGLLGVAVAAALDAVEARALRWSLTSRGSL